MSRVLFSVPGLTGTAMVLILLAMVSCFYKCPSVFQRVSCTDLCLNAITILGSFRFEDEDEDEDEDEALCFRHNEIFKLFRLQLGRDDEVDCNNIVTPSLSRI